MTTTMNTELVATYLRAIEAFDPATATDEEVADVIGHSRMLIRQAEAVQREVIADVRTIPARPKGQWYGGTKVIRAPHLGMSTSHDKVETKTMGANDPNNERWTWAAIGSVLGCSAQAANQRFGKKRAQ